MNPDRLIAEIAQKVEAEYTPQPRSRITPKLSAQLAAKMKRRKYSGGKELDAVKEIAARMRFY